MATIASHSGVANPMDYRVDEARFVEVRESTCDPERGWYLPLKTAADVVMAVLLLIPGIPVIAIAALAVRLTSRGPAFYAQKRLGRDGRVFSLIKLRSMVVDAEKGTGPVWATADDPRVTPVGRFLRESHIDEFPQLFNVVLGQMSLVGPRPERPELAGALEQKVPRYRDRLRLRPGITGFTQLRLPPDTDVAGVRRKVICDLYYIQNVSPWFDFRILVHTAWQFVRSVSQCACQPFARLWCLPQLQEIAPAESTDRLSVESGRNLIRPIGAVVAPRRPVLNESIVVEGSKGTGSADVLPGDLRWKLPEMERSRRSAGVS